MEKSNKVIDITGDIMHNLACEFDVTLREINKLVGNRVFNLVCDVNHNFNS